MAKVPPEPYDGPYCSFIDLAAYQTLGRDEQVAMGDEMKRVMDENFPELREHSALSGPGIGLIRVDSPQKVLVGLRLNLDLEKLAPGELSPVGVYPNLIGCVPLEIRVTGLICTAAKFVVDARVVDDETGDPIEGAYWRSETLDGEIFLELMEEGDHEQYRLVEDGSVIAERATESGSEDFRVVASKSGYVTLVRQLTVIVGSCHIREVVGDQEFRLVKGSPGEDDVFRAHRLPEGATRPMAQVPRPLTYHTATLLRDGKVLVVGGGKYAKPHSTIEAYDPAVNAWVPQAGLLIARRSHAAVLLEDGRVLVAGGTDQGWDQPTSAELLGHSFGEASRPAGDMFYGYYSNTLTLLEDGRGLVIGGSTPSTEAYDPRANRWSFAGNMTRARFAHTATLLADGRVLAAGGIDDASASDFVNDSTELFNPVTGLWSQTGSMKEVRHSHTATLLEDGRVLVVGGETFSGRHLSTSEIYDPNIGEWTFAANLNYQRAGHTATLLLDGRVLVAGGAGRSVEVYEPASDTWSPAAEMKHRRTNHTATLLLDGRVLVVGGAEGAGSYASAEIYDPARDSWD